MRGPADITDCINADMRRLSTQDDLSGLFGKIAKAERLGFREVRGTIHSSQTILSVNAQLLIEEIGTDVACWNRATIEEAILHRNLFSKRTESARIGSLRDMIALYGFDRPPPVTRAAFKLWSATANHLLLLGALAVARDPILRATSAVIFETPIGEAINYRTMVKRLDSLYPERFSVGTLRAIGERCVSSWGQIGHLGHGKVRQRISVNADSANAAFAAFLAISCGLAGSSILDSGWFRMLDVSPEQGMSLLRRAEAEGHVRLRVAGHVTDISLAGEHEDLTKGGGDYGLI